MNTPHISIRVDKAELESWRAACKLKNTNVSEMTRKLMNAFAHACQAEQEMKEMLYDFREGEYANL